MIGAVGGWRPARLHKALWVIAGVLGLPLSRRGAKGRVHQRAGAWICVNRITLPEKELGEEEGQESSEDMYLEACSEITLRPVRAPSLGLPTPRRDQQTPLPSLLQGGQQMPAHARLPPAGKRRCTHPC